MFQTSSFHHQKDHLYMQFYGVFMHLCKQSSRWKDVLDTCTKGLPDVEHMMFETCRRHQELN